ncbi:MAG: hypothetical protein ACJ795_19415 [Ktedonobacteraceae bacterium]
MTDVSWQDRRPDSSQDASKQDRASLENILIMLNGFRRGTLEDKYVIICTRPGEEWRVGQVCTDPTSPIKLLEGHMYASIEAAEQAISHLRR